MNRAEALAVLKTINAPFHCDQYKVDVTGFSFTCAVKALGSYERAERYLYALVKVGAPGQANIVDLNFLAVWREEGGSWHFLAWQSCKNPPPAPAIPTSPAAPNVNVTMI